MGSNLARSTMKALLARKATASHPMKFASFDKCAGPSLFSAPFEIEHAILLKLSLAIRGHIKVDLTS